MESPARYPAQSIYVQQVMGPVYYQHGQNTQVNNSNGEPDDPNNQPNGPNGQPNGPNGQPDGPNGQPNDQLDDPNGQYKCLNGQPQFVLCFYLLMGACQYTIIII